MVARIALATDSCCCGWSIHRVRQQLIDDSIIKYRDIHENVISCSPGINRLYRVIGIFLTISPVRHRNPRYIKNRDLLHKYLEVPITTHTHVRRKSIGKKEKKRRDREERKGVLYSDSRSPCVKPKQVLIALICCGQYIYGC